MKLSYNWLREWVTVPASAQELTERITLAGLESSAEPMSGEIPSGVVVGRIVKAEKLPQADKLQLCEVDVGSGSHLQIVCGAPNARVGLCAPCAKVGAKLPGGAKIEQAKLRGTDSFGMLCSAKELGLSEKSEGLLELDADAKPGTPIEQYLSFQDEILNLEFTPNRGDALSVLGLAREVAALYNLPMKRPNLPPAVVVGHALNKVEVEDPADCPNYLGRVVSKLKPKSRTPDWMREKLRRSGIRAIHPVVDITNYVMLELGQPLHAFDSAKITGAIRVRKARKGEQLKILTGDTLTLDHGELLIADDKGALGLAGVMGGDESGVTDSTVSIFLESACFAPHAVSGTGRRHKLHSDAVYRFERGVDPGLQRIAIDRASQLLLQICGGEVHPITQVGRTPEIPPIRLRQARVDELLGHVIPPKEIEALLARLGILLQQEKGGWAAPASRVTDEPGVQVVRRGGNSWSARIPTHRNDLRIEHDLIEELARLYGYDNIPAPAYRAAVPPSRPAETQRSFARAADTLIARGWQEAVTLSFADAKIQQRLTPHLKPVALDNPIAENLAQMRTTLWPGLIGAWLHNHQRQHKRVRLFEAGVCFELGTAGIVETQRIGGLAAGGAFSEQWGQVSRAVDFYDIKADAVSLLGIPAEFRFEVATHPALHPGQCARITRMAGGAGQHVGWIGALHPALVKPLDLPEAPYLFELDWPAVRNTALPKIQPLSEFPSSRRDLAVVVAEAITAQQIIDCAHRVGGNLLQKVTVFDIYRGKGLDIGCKSVAFGLIFNDYSRTLTVENIDTAVIAVSRALERELGAVIRQ